MNFAYFFTTAAALCFAQEFESDGFKVLQKYKDFKLRYSIEYSDSNEDAYRFRLFRENVALIEETNRKNLSYTMGINKFTGMTKAEFAKHMVCKKSSLSIIRRKSKELFNSDDERFTGEAADLESHLYKRSLQKIPTSINWAQKGAVNPSVDQGNCGSCYAMSGLGLLETAVWEAEGTLPKLSVQQIIDCSREEGNEGCDAGSALGTLQYVSKNGVVASQSYPYTARAGTCKKQIVSDRSKQIYQPGDIGPGDLITLEPRRLDQLLLHLQEGPLSIAVNTKPANWKSYKGGILEGFPCDGPPDHAVLLVGYGVDKAKGKSYWIIRNSWGTSWGENGYARIIRDPEAKIGSGFCNMAQLGAVRVTLVHPT